MNIKPSLSLRRWKLSDAKFVVKIRNRPNLMKWFRQDHKLTVREQVLYMSTHPEYRGYIIYEGNKPVGVVANHKEELCVAAPFKYHREAIKLLEEVEQPKRLFGDVLIGNPMLKTYLKSGYKIKSMRIEKCEF